jgi:guanine nucleotide exchange protein RalF
MFLKAFRLPGEADQIDRVIEKFAIAYILQNPRFNDTGDQIYLLAYSLIMLNTLNHNPRVNAKLKLTEAQFVK